MKKNVLLLMLCCILPTAIFAQKSPQSICRDNVQKGTGHFCPCIDVLSEMGEESNNKTTYLPLSLQIPCQKSSQKT